MRINNNIMAINTHRQYTINNSSIAKSAEKLSSGYRINRAGDDAAGLAISEKMRAQIRGLNMASKNSSDAISLVQTTEGALQEVHNILQRVRELSVQAASDTNDKPVDRAALDLEVQQLKDEIVSISQVTTFNGISVLQPPAGLKSNDYVIQSGANSGDTLNLKIYGLALQNVGAPIKNSQPPLPSYIPTKPADVDYTKISGNAAGTAHAVATSGDLAKLLSAAEAMGADLSGLDSDQLNALKDATTMDAMDFNTFLAAQTTGTIEDLYLAAKAKVDADYVNAVKAYGSEMVNYAANVVKVAQYYDATGVTGGDPADITDAITDALDAMDTIVDAADAKAAADTEITALLDAANAFTSALADGTVAAGASTTSSFKIRQSVDMSAVSITTRDNAQQAINTVNDAVNALSMQRAQLGAYQNRLEHKIANLDTSAENLQAAESRIRDVDMAKEMTNFTKNNILAQASTAMLSQANSAPQGVLQLLR